MPCLAFLAASLASGQDYQDYPAPRQAPRFLPSNDIKPTPVPILKQINRHNEDGSYTYGFEAADGSFKIETKLANGDVKGKYGYKDETGNVRTVEYGADKYGFQPSGVGITVPPPTLVDESRKQAEEQPELGYRQQPAAPRRPSYRPAPVQQQVEYDQYDDSNPAYPIPQQYSQQTPAPYVAPAVARAKANRPSFFSGAPLSPEQPSFNFQQNTPRPAPYFRPESAGQYAQSLYTQTPRPQYIQPAPRDESHIQYSPTLFQQPEEQRPAYSPAQFRQGPQQAQGGRPSLLDQLMKEYGLPQGGSAPLHDITFGTY